MGSEMCIRDSYYLHFIGWRHGVISHFGCQTSELIKLHRRGRKEMPRGQAGTGAATTQAVQVEKDVLARIDDKIRERAAGMEDLGIEFTDRQLSGARKQFIEKAIQSALTDAGDGAAE